MRRTQLFASAEAAEEAFYDAMERADVDAMMALWAEDEDAVCVHSGGARLIGLPAIRAAWAERFAAGGMHVRPSGLKAWTSGTLAVHHVIEQVVVESRLGPQLVQQLATNVYVKGPIGWQIVMHQAAPLDGSTAATEAPGEATGDPSDRGSSGVLH